MKTLKEVKDKLDNISVEIKNKEISGGASIDYIIEVENQKELFHSYALETDKEIQKLIITEIKKRIAKIDEDKVIEFDFAKELGQCQVGRIALASSPERLSKMIKAPGESNRQAVDISKNKKQVVAYTVTIIDKNNPNSPCIKIIKKLNLVSILSKNRKKAQIGFIEGKVRGIGEDVIIISPESFDVVVMDDTAFIFDERNFHFLFSKTEYLKGVVDQNKQKLSQSLLGYEHLVEYAEKNPSVLRGLFHVLSKEDDITMDIQKVKYIEDRINSQTGSKRQIFEYNGNKIVCTRENAKYIYWLVAKKYGLNVIDDDLFVTGSQYPLK